MNVPRALRELIEANDPTITCVLRLPVDYDSHLPLAELLTVPGEALPEPWEMSAHVQITCYGNGLNETYAKAYRIRQAINGPAQQTAEGLLDDVFPVQDPTEIGWPHETICAVQAVYGVVYRISE